MCVNNLLTFGALSLLYNNQTRNTMKTRLINVAGETEAITNTSTFWKPIDAIRMQIDQYNKAKGLKTRFQGAWTYDSLVQYAVRNGIPYDEAETLTVEELIEIAEKFPRKF